MKKLTSYFLILIAIWGIFSSQAFGTPTTSGMLTLPQGSYSGYLVNAIHVTPQGYAYIATAYDGLLIVDATDASSPKYVSTVDIPWAKDVDISGNYAYVAAIGPDLTIINISDPQNPVVTGTFEIKKASAEVVMLGANHLFLVMDDKTIQSIDISDPANPFLVGTLDLSAASDAQQYQFSNPYIYALTYQGSLMIYDTSTGVLPNLISILDLNIDLGWNLAVSSPFVYVAGKNTVTNPSGGTNYVYTIYAIDASNPLAPSILGSIDTIDNFYLYTSDNKVLMTGYDMNAFKGYFQIFDADDPKNLKLSSSIEQEEKQGVYANGNLYFVGKSTPTSMSGDDTFKIIDLNLPDTSSSIASIPNAPFLGVTATDINLAAFWQPVKNASGYTLWYAPYPSSSPVNSVDLGSQTSFSADLWNGAAYFIALQAYNSNGSSPLSNIENFAISQDGPQLSSTWQGTWNSSYGGTSGNFTVNLSRSLLSLSGTLNADTGNTTCPAVYGIPLSGIISNNGSQIDFAVNTKCGNSDIAFKFAQGIISGNTITGTFQLQINGYSSSYGSFQMQHQ